MGSSARKNLCQSVRNAPIFVDSHQRRNFIMWMKQTFPGVESYNKNFHQCTEHDGDISFHQKFQNVELLRCDYGISEVYLTKVASAEDYYTLNMKHYNSEMLFTIGWVAHILQSLLCNKNVQDGFIEFKEVFQRRLHGMGNNN